MVFSSVPLFLDPPNWNQLHHQAPLLLPPPAAAAPSMMMAPPQPMATPPGRAEPSSTASGTGGQTSSSSPAAAQRPVSMTERARLAKIPQPEPGLKCPRCDSSNTKFCYFNNYSLTQPRHFCKTCRRYWTRGGALRNVPVGGGCRRNKRSSKSNNKSSSTSAASATSASASASGASTPSASSTATGGSAALPGIMAPATSNIPFLATLQSLSEYSGVSLGFPGFAPFSPVMEQHHQPPPPEFPLGGASINVGLEQWRLPFFGRIEPPVAPALPGSVSTVPFDVDSEGGFSSHVMAPGLITQMASVKMEENAAAAAALSQQRELLGIHSSIPFWGAGPDGGGNAWSSTTDLSVFNGSMAPQGNVL